MPVLAKSAQADEFDNYYIEQDLLEQALLAHSVNKPLGYKKICSRINDILNRVVRDEVRYGVYNEHVIFSKEEYAELIAV
ncbi:MAG: hypothetical protein FWC73_09790 [Defluviitaleaceae bacterium]|nr:hypothetical protein [Defluviitaleaceae bacterium]